MYYQGLDNVEEEKKGIVTREIDKFRETMKIREAEKEEQDKKRKGSKSPSRRKSKSRERDSESRSRCQINHKAKSQIMYYVPTIYTASRQGLKEARSEPQ